MTSDSVDHNPVPEQTAEKFPENLAQVARAAGRRDGHQRLHATALRKEPDDAARGPEDVLDVVGLRQLELVDDDATLRAIGKQHQPADLVVRIGTRQEAQSRRRGDHYLPARAKDAHAFAPRGPRPAYVLDRLEAEHDIKSNVAK